MAKMKGDSAGDQARERWECLFHQALPCRDGSSREHGMGCRTSARIQSVKEEHEVLDDWKERVRERL
jgi:hypothetical protein